MSIKPIYSMTGYGRGEKSTNSRRITAEIKSVNNRFLDLQIRGISLPVDIENKISLALKANIGRGSVVLNISVTDTAGITAPPSVNIELLKYYKTFFEEAATVLSLPDKPTLANLFTLPEVIKIQSKSGGSIDPTLENDLLETLSLTVLSLNEMREKEGSALVRDLSERISKIRLLADEALKAAPERTEAFRKRLSEKAAEVFKEGLDDSLRARLMMEVTIMADRTDVSEEITRLHSHCDQVEDAINGGGAIGKKLNFIQQEIGREANTLSSKAQDSALLRIALAIKEESESIREQIQNIE